MQAYVWKPIFLHDVFRQQARNASVWYGDDGPIYNNKAALPGEPSNLRVNFCSMLPWTGAKIWGLTESGPPGRALEYPAALLAFAL